MKFKILVIILNIVLLLVFVSIFFIPVLNPAFSEITGKKYLFFIPVFLVLIIIFNAVYFKNRKIVESIESEDWTAVCLHLEDEVFSKKRMSFKNVRLLSETMLLLSDFAGLERLETTVRANKPEYLAKIASNLAGGKLLSGKYQSLYDFTSGLAARRNNTDQWIVFYTAFSLQMLKEHKKAAERFLEIYDKVSVPLIRAMTGYFIFNILATQAKLTPKEAESGKQELKKEILNDYNYTKWQEYTEKQKEAIHILVFKKVIDDTTDWLYK
ncbi:MAG: hypothetical protein CR988_00865 [Treponema sp.]|nr:MAG: hypothetical protein CR988_00865 [Treponema sp.]